MIGYIFIVISVLFNGVKGYSSKRVSGSLNTLRQNFSFNAFRNFVTCLFALLVVLLSGVSDIFSVTAAEFAICAAAGAAMAVFTGVWLLAIRSKAYMLVSACSSASFVVPVLCGLILWNEKFTVPGAVSFVLVVCALYFLLKYDFKLNGKISGSEILLLVFVLVSQGITQCTQKMYALYVPNKDSGCYTLYMFFFAFCASLIVLSMLPKPVAEEKHSVIRKNMGYIIVMSGALFAASYFQTLAAKTVDAVIMYPIANALSLALGSTMSAVFFKEKLNKNSVTGIVLVFCALVLSKF